jgi:osmotically-inducible protein OsmY
MVKRHRILSFLVCIGLIAVFLGCASTPTRESTGEYIDDSTITTKVKAAIFNDPSLKVFQINVETFKGEVQLSGSVDSAQSVKKAGEVARSVGGVKSVKNDLIVK